MMYRHFVRVIVFDFVGLCRGFSREIVKATHRKLMLLSKVQSINELRVPPANRLEKLFGNRKGQYSIRVNDQFRLCFSWIEGNAVDVELVDYH